VGQLPKEQGLGVISILIKSEAPIGKAPIFKKIRKTTKSNATFLPINTYY
jgi:hypothetical protein